MSVTLSGPMVVPESGNADHLVVLLHGYGSDGNDLIALAPHFKPILPNAIFVAPNAPQPCAINPMGFEWFPLDLDRDISRLTGIGATRPLIAGFLSDLWAQTGLSADKTILIGFSQGAMIALDSGLRLAEPLMAILSFSGGLVAPEEISAELKSKPPVCLVHGDRDDVVPPAMSLAGAKALEGLGVRVKLHLCEGAGHTIAADGLAFAQRFVADLAADLAAGAVK